MKKLIPILFLLISTVSYSQIYFYTSQMMDQICPNDPDITVQVPDLVEIYQTDDNTPFGAIDESICIGVAGSPTNINTVDISQVNIDKPLFFRHKIYQDFTNAPLQPNQIYNINGNLNDNPAYFNFADNCSGEFCSKIIVGYTVPNEDGTGLNKKIVDLEFGDQCDVFSCKVTQGFETDQYIYEAIIQVSLTQEAKDKGEIKFPSLVIATEEFFDVNLITDDIEISQDYHDNIDTYTVPPWAVFGGWGPIVFGYGLPDYPSDATRDYIEFYPEVNNPDPQNIIITTDGFESVLFQDFVSLRAGLRLGSNDERHNLDFQIESSVCLFSVEFVAGNGTTVSFKQGSSIDLFGNAACIQLREASQMIITDNKHLQYGRLGVGNLAIKDDSKIIIKDGSQLTFDGTILINSYDDKSDNDFASIVLEKGSKLKFTSNATIKNFHLDNYPLDIYMNGGSLDMNDLPEEQKAKIRLIYPEKSNHEFLAFPNPASDVIHIPTEIIEDTPYDIIDFRNRIVTTGIVTSFDQKVDISALQKGMYIMRLKEESKSTISKFVKID